MILLETFPGWPEAPAMSGLEYLLLMVVGPIIAGAVVTALVYARSWAGRGAETPAVPATRDEHRQDAQ